MIDNCDCGVLIYLLWMLTYQGIHGQDRIDAANVCLLNASSVGAETLKNVVLPGIKNILCFCNFFQVLVVSPLLINTRLRSAIWETIFLSRWRVLDKVGLVKWQKIWQNWIQKWCRVIGRRRILYFWLKTSQNFLIPISTCMHCWFLTRLQHCIAIGSIFVSKIGTIVLEKEQGIIAGAFVWIYGICASHCTPAYSCGSQNG